MYNISFYVYEQNRYIKYLFRHMLVTSETNLLDLKSKNQSATIISDHAIGYIITWASAHAQ